MSWDATVISNGSYGKRETAGTLSDQTLTSDWLFWYIQSPSKITGKNVVSGCNLLIYENITVASGYVTHAFGAALLNNLKWSWWKHLILCNRLTGATRVTYSCVLIDKVNPEKSEDGRWHLLNRKPRRWCTEFQNCQWSKTSTMHQTCWKNSNNYETTRILLHIRKLTDLGNYKIKITFKMCPCGIYDGQSGTGQVSLRFSRVSPVSIIQP
jgi:hypothetical protein